VADHAAADGTPHEIRSKPTGRPEGWFAACTCGWTGPARERQALTLRDLFDHCKETNE